VLDEPGDTFPAADAVSDAAEPFADDAFAAPCADVSENAVPVGEPFEGSVP
jgi:hypothetical protein